MLGSPLDRLEPYSVLPSQVVSPTVLSPELNLVWSLIEDAVLLAVGRRAAGPGGARRSSAITWLADSSTEPFSFLWCAEAFDVDVAQLRRAAGIL